MSIHAKMPTGDEPLCKHFFVSWSPEKVNDKTTIRYGLVSCAGCVRLMRKYPQLVNRAYIQERFNGETGTLDRQAGDETARRYWQEREKEGANIPAWARILYIEERGLARR